MSLFVPDAAAPSCARHCAALSSPSAMARCALMLVPGFPMINAVADLVKGYTNTGVARAMMACLLGAAVSGGILLAMRAWHIPVSF